MRKTLNVVIVIVCAAAGAWVGYWIGYALGWTENAQWPWRYGGGTGAILLAFGVSVVFAAGSYLILMYNAGHGVRRALENGVPAWATLLSIETTGDHTIMDDESYEQVRCELEVRPRDGVPYQANVVQFLTEGYLQRLQEDTKVKVRYDSSRPSNVAIIEPTSHRKSGR